MSDNVMASDTIKELVRALRRHRSQRRLLLLRAGNGDIVLRPSGTGARSEHQGTRYRLLR